MLAFTDDLNGYQWHPWISWDHPWILRRHSCNNRKFQNYKFISADYPWIYECPQIVHVYPSWIHGYYLWVMHGYPFHVISSLQCSFSKFSIFKFFNFQISNFRVFKNVEGGSPYLRLINVRWLPSSLVSAI